MLESQPDIEQDRRHWERVALPLFGRCMLPNKLEIPCQAVNISPGDAAIIAAHLPQIGDLVIIYFDHLGRIEGTAIRHFKGGFAITIHGTERKREKLATRIEWMKEHLGDPDTGHELRRHNRIEPRNNNSEIKLEDGRTYPIKIIDISLSGAALEVDVRPALGEMVWLAGMQGKVVRHFAEGIAMEFIAKTDQLIPA